MEGEQPLQFFRKQGYARIRKDRVARLRYAVFERENDAVIEFRDDLWYLHGGYGGAFPKVEQALEGGEVGDKVEVELTPEEGYGPRAAELVVTEPPDAFPPEARQVGARLEGHAPDGHVVQFVVTRVTGREVTVDGNHPLAGKHLRFVFEVLEVRDATARELRAGHAIPDAAPRAD